MNGELHGLCAITLHANKALRENTAFAPLPENYILDRKFIFSESFGFCMSAEKWFEVSVKRGMHAVQLIVPVKSRNRSLLGFVNMTRAYLVLFRKDRGPAVLVPYWSFDPENNGWHVIYRENEWVDKSVGVPVFEDETEELISVLGEIEALAEKLTGGDEDARDAARTRLTEGNLHYAVILAREFAGKGVPLIDLIQETNLSLMESLDAYGAGDGDLEDFLEKGARKTLRALVKEEEGFARMQEDMTNAANRVLEAVKEQEAEEGRALSAEELAERLGMPVSRVEAVLKESAKAIRNAEK